MFVCVSGPQGDVIVRVSDSRAAHGKWWFSQQIAQSEILLKVHSPADASIGLYSMAVLLLSAEGHILEESSPHFFHLIFNPWCQGDLQYLFSDKG